MHPRDWKAFLEKGEGKEIAVAQLSDELNAHMGGPSRHVYMQHDYAKKSAEKHGIPPEDFPLIFETIDYGIPVKDRPRHITFYRYFKDSDRWIQVTVKCCEERKVNWIATFYRLKTPEVKRRQKRLGVQLLQEEEVRG